MTQPKSPRSPVPATADAVPAWTVERMKTFIAALRRTRNVAGAAREAGMSRQSAYALRARLPGHPFDLAWAAAMGPREAFRRMTAGYAALQGVTPPDAG